MLRRFFSIMLVVFSTVLIIVVFGWNYVQKKISVEVGSSLKNFIMNGGQGIEYKGADKNGVKFYLKASTLKEITEDHLKLENICFQATLLNKKEITIQAKEMDFIKSKNIAYLIGDVFMQTTDNVTLKTSQANLYIHEGYIEGNEDVISTRNDNVTIRSKGFKIDNLEGNIVFKGQPVFEYQKTS